MSNRKLIKPTVGDNASVGVPKYATYQRKKVPPEQTHAENYYYVKQMNNKTPMCVRLVNGEELLGVIEWYDKNCIKLNRDYEPNLLIYKSSILYMYKAEESQIAEMSRKRGKATK